MARLRAATPCIDGSHTRLEAEANKLTRYLNIVQIIISIAMITLIVMQRRGGGLGSLAGDSSIYHTRRGVEKTIHNLTIVLAIAFGLTSLLSVILQ